MAEDRPHIVPLSGRISACTECFASKRKCSGETPCQRCVALGKGALCMKKPEVPTSGTARESTQSASVVSSMKLPGKLNENAFMRSPYAVPESIFPWQSLTSNYAHKLVELLVTGSPVSQMISEIEAAYVHLVDLDWSLVDHQVQKFGLLASMKSPGSINDRLGTRRNRGNSDKEGRYSGFDSEYGHKRVKHNGLLKGSNDVAINPSLVVHEEPAILQSQYQLATSAPLLLQEQFSEPELQNNSSEKVELDKKSSSCNSVVEAKLSSSTPNFISAEFALPHLQHATHSSEVSHFPSLGTATTLTDEGVISMGGDSYSSSETNISSGGSCASAVLDKPTIVNVNDTAKMGRFPEELSHVEFANFISHDLADYKMIAAHPSVVSELWDLGLRENIIDVSESPLWTQNLPSSPQVENLLISVYNESVSRFTNLPLPAEFSPPAGITFKEGMTVKDVLDMGAKQGIPVYAYATRVHAPHLSQSDLGKHYDAAAAGAPPALALANSLFTQLTGITDFSFALALASGADISFCADSCVPARARTEMLARAAGESQFQFRGAYKKAHVVAEGETPLFPFSPDQKDQFVVYAALAPWHPCPTCSQSLSQGVSPSPLKHNCSYADWTRFVLRILRGESSDSVIAELRTFESSRCKDEPLPLNQRYSNFFVATECASIVYPPNFLTLPSLRASEYAQRAMAPTTRESIGSTILGLHSFAGSEGGLAAAYSFLQSDPALSLAVPSDASVPKIDGPDARGYATLVKGVKGGLKKKKHGRRGRPPSRRTILAIRKMEQLVRLHSDQTLQSVINSKKSKKSLPEGNGHENSDEEFSQHGSSDSEFEDDDNEEDGNIDSADDVAHHNSSLIDRNKVSKVSQSNEYDNLNHSSILHAETGDNTILKAESTMLSEDLTSVDNFCKDKLKGDNLVSDGLEISPKVTSISSLSSSSVSTVGFVGDSSAQSVVSSSSTLKSGTSKSISSTLLMSTDGIPLPKHFSNLPFPIPNLPFTAPLKLSSENVLQVSRQTDAEQNFICDCRGNPIPLRMRVKNGVTAVTPSSTAAAAATVEISQAELVSHSLKSFPYVITIVALDRVTTPPLVSDPLMTSLLSPFAFDARSTQAVSSALKNTEKLKEDMYDAKMNHSATAAIAAAVANGMSLSAAKEKFSVLPGSQRLKTPVINSPSFNSLVQVNGVTSAAAEMDLLSDISESLTNSDILSAPSSPSRSAPPSPTKLLNEFSSFPVQPMIAPYGNFQLPPSDYPVGHPMQQVYAMSQQNLQTELLAQRSISTNQGISTGNNVTRHLAVQKMNSLVASTANVNPTANAPADIAKQPRNLVNYLPGGIAIVGNPSVLSSSSNISSSTASNSFNGSTAPSNRAASSLAIRKGSPMLAPLDTSSSPTRLMFPPQSIPIPASVSSMALHTYIDRNTRNASSSNAKTSRDVSNINSAKLESSDSNGLTIRGFVDGSDENMHGNSPGEVLKALISPPAPASERRKPGRPRNSPKNVSLSTFSFPANSCGIVPLPGNNTLNSTSTASATGSSDKNTSRFIENAKEKDKLRLPSTPLLPFPFPFDASTSISNPHALSVVASNNAFPLQDTATIAQTKSAVPRLVVGSPAALVRHPARFVVPAIEIFERALDSVELPLSLQRFVEQRANWIAQLQLKKEKHFDFFSSADDLNASADITSSSSNSSTTAATKAHPSPSSTTTSQWKDTDLSHPKPPLFDSPYYCVSKKYPFSYRKLRSVDLMEAPSLRPFIPPSRPNASVSAFFGDSNGSKNSQMNMPINMPPVNMPMPIPMSMPMPMPMPLPMPMPMSMPMPLSMPMNMSMNMNMAPQTNNSYNSLPISDSNHGSSVNSNISHSNDFVSSGSYGFRPSFPMIMQPNDMQNNQQAQASFASHLSSSTSSGSISATSSGSSSVTKSLVSVNSMTQSSTPMYSPIMALPPRMSPLPMFHAHMQQGRMDMTSNSLQMMNYGMSHALGLGHYPSGSLQFSHPNSLSKGPVSAPNSMPMTMSMSPGTSTHTHLNAMNMNMNMNINSMSPSVSTRIPLDHHIFAQNHMQSHMQSYQAQLPLPLDIHEQYHNLHVQSSQNSNPLALFNNPQSMHFSLPVPVGLPPPSSSSNSENVSNYANDN